MVTGQPWQVRSALPAGQLTEVPRPDSDPCGLPDAGVAQRAVALASACESADAVALAWVRERPPAPAQATTTGPPRPAEALTAFARLPWPRKLLARPGGWSPAGSGKPGETGR